MIEEEKKIITREKHPGRVAQGHKLAALMKKKKKYCVTKNNLQNSYKTVLQYSLQNSHRTVLQYNLQNSYRTVFQ